MDHKVEVSNALVPGSEAPSANKGGRRRRSRSRSRRASLNGGMLVGMMPPMGGRRRRSLKKMEGGASYGFYSGPYTGPGTITDGNKSYIKLGPEEVPQPIKGGVQIAGRRRNTRKAGKAAKGGKKPMSPWLEHVMAIKNKGGKAMSLGEAMKEAKKTYKK